MNELTPKPVGGSLVGSILHGSSDKFPIPAPYSQEVFLMETNVAGTSHIDGIDEICKNLAPEERLSLLREPKNEYDSNAIVIKTSKGVKLGYVPKAKNDVVSRLLDAGKLLFAVIQKIEPKERWVNITIKVFLQD